MGGDLPDYTKKQVLVIDIANFPQEVMVDHRKIKGLTLKDPTEPLCVPSSVENIVRIDHQQIKGLALKDPLIPLCVPISWEGPYLAYEPCIDAWKVKIVEWAAGALSISIANDWARELGLVDLSRVLGAALSHSNPVISRLTDGAAFIDPRDRSWTITENLARNWVLGATDVPDLSDRAARLLGVIANTSFQVSNFPSTYDVSDREGRLLGIISGTATVTQAAKDRTISSVDATATPLQINISALNGNSSALVTPASGKAIRVKFISLQHSADVDIGYRFGAAGNIYYLRTTKGTYVSNLVGCNNQGAADAAFYLNSSAATNVKGYILYSEV